MPDGEKQNNSSAIGVRLIFGLVSAAAVLFWSMLPRLDERLEAGNGANGASRQDSKRAATLDLPLSSAQTRQDLPGLFGSRASAAPSIEGTRAGRVSALGDTGTSTSGASSPMKAAAEESYTAAAGIRPESGYPLLSEQSSPVKPSGVVVFGGDLYFLTADSLWICTEGNAKLANRQPLILRRLKPPQPEKLKGVPIQEFLSAVYFPARQSIVVLDKSGSLFEYVPGSRSWKLLRANKQTLGSPDPHYISIASDGSSLLLLDTERNQIWRYPAPVGKERYFREVLPWRVKTGDPWVADGVAIAHDRATLLLRRRGQITSYDTDSLPQNSAPHPVKFKPPPDIRPTGLFAGEDNLLYVLERQNNRILCIDRYSGTFKQFLFSSQSDLRAIAPGTGGFWVINGNMFIWRAHSAADLPDALPHPSIVDSRLQGLTIPVKGARLPGHTGVFPGARRLYRHGVHQGLDFFADAGKITMNTPAVAADAGKVIRADINYKDMDAKQYSGIMSDCERRQFCSEANEDFFRGCQVWIDHGRGLVTRYAHLNRVRSDLRPGMSVGRGEVIGFIGVSGTGENLRSGPGHPHLHFEIWLDGHYLGYGLNPAETVSLYEDIFGRIGKRGS